MIYQKEDVDSSQSLEMLKERERLFRNQVADIRTVLVVLSARGMAFDIESLRQKVLSAYPDAAVFFCSTMGKSVGVAAPHKVDLVIDFTGLGQRQGLGAFRLKRVGRIVVGRSGWIRSRLYHRLFNEKIFGSALLRDWAEREFIAQREVLALVGIAAAIYTGDTTEDRSRTIALDLPPLLRRP